MTLKISPIVQAWNRFHRRRNETDRLQLYTVVIRAIKGHPLETKVFREERSNVKIQVERERTSVRYFRVSCFPLLRSEWVPFGWPRVVVVSCLTDPRIELISVLHRTAVRLETCSLVTALPFLYFHHYTIACDFFDRSKQSL